jgi:hypothetical protein
MIGRLCLAAMAALVTSMAIIDAPSAREITYMGTPFGPRSFDRNFPAITNLPLRLKGASTFFFIEGISSDVTLRSYYAAPEPSTWAMMALGFGGIGFVAFRKRRKLVPV